MACEISVAVPEDLRALLAQMIDDGQNASKYASDLTWKLERAMAEPLEPCSEGTPGRGFWRHAASLIDLFFDSSRLFRDRAYSALV